MLYLIYCKNVTRQLSSAAQIMQGQQHFKIASQFALPWSTLRGLRFHGPGPELATEFIFLFFFYSIFAQKKLNAGNSILKRIFSCLFSIKAEKAGFSVAFFPAARPLHSATWPRDPFPSLCFVMLQLFKIWLCLGKRWKTAKGKMKKGRTAKLWMQLTLLPLVGKHGNQGRMLLRRKYFL